MNLAELRRYAVRYDSMSLMVYRELAAHLACVAGVETELEPSKETTFRYQDSQIESLQIRQAPDADVEQIKRILDHYGSWKCSVLED